MNITKFRLPLAVTTILVVVVATYFYISRAHRDAARGSDTRTFISPNRQTTVEINEKVEETPPPTIRDSVVRFTVFQNSNRVIDNEILFRDSPPGPNFFSRYPKQVWVTDSILRFIESDPSPGAMNSEVLVINETEKEISYLRVIAGDIFLILRLPPKSRIPLESVSLERGDMTYLSLGGRFADGGQIRQESAHVDSNVDPGHHSIVIRDAGVVISK